MAEVEMKCPTCDFPMERIDLAPRGIVVGVCKACSEFGQQMPDGGSVVPLSEALKAHAMGDDRIRAAISKPRPGTLQSFLETYELINRIFSLDLASSMGSLRTLLAQIENRLDSAISGLAELEFVNDQAGRVLTILREARELVSVLPSRNRGLRAERPPT